MYKYAEFDHYIYTMRLRSYVHYLLKYLDRPKWCSAKPRHCLAYQCLYSVKVNKYAHFDPNISCENFTN